VNDPRDLSIIVDHPNWECARGGIHDLSNAWRSNGHPMGNIYARAIFAEMHGEQAYARHGCSVVKHTCGTWSRISKTRALVFRGFNSAPY